MLDLGAQSPRVFAQGLGVDFAKAVVEGLKARAQSDAPETLSRVTLIVNTARMARRITTLFAQSGPGFLPRILLLGQIETLLPPEDRLPKRSPLARRLQLAQLLAPILESRPQLAGRRSLFDIVDSLAALIDEMQGESVTPDRIAALDISDASGNWQVAQTLIGIAHEFLAKIEDGVDAEARQRIHIETLTDRWADTPPQHPIILAGSTGSRGTTAHLMRAIARLQNGAVLLPGLDRDMPIRIWEALQNPTEPLAGEDHPQYRFAKLFHDLDIRSAEVPDWHKAQDPDPARQRFISLALRPAPVTDDWCREGPNLPNLVDTLKNLTLLEAQSPREEALCIAMRLRQAAEAGQKAALITQDRLLTRQVTAAMDRWRILPDDSAGLPLHLSAPGRFLRHTADLFRSRLDSEQILTLLKHPMTLSCGTYPAHGLYTQWLEMRLRKARLPFPTATDLATLITSEAEAHDGHAKMVAWGDLLAETLCGRIVADPLPLHDWLQRHRHLAETLSGSQGQELWAKAAGQAAQAAFEELEQNAQHADLLSAADYAQLLTRVLAQGEVRESQSAHPGIMIWGTLEARVQGADLVILGGLNEGSWPAALSMDAWLNRRMRSEAGLLLPERQVGLAAHDFQQAIAAPDVWLTRSLTSDGSETVPARWLNRMSNLAEGLPERDGPQAFAAMRARGNAWRNRAQLLEAVEPQPAARRAAPCPPIAARPRNFSVTEIKTLIRDPYAIYAKHVLRLRRLDPLVQPPDAALRGTIFHDILHDFILETTKNPDLITAEGLKDIASRVLAKDVPWRLERALWQARLERIADWIVDQERARQIIAKPVAMERGAQGILDLPQIGGRLTARADRIDLTPQGDAAIYDYKTGAPPTPSAQKVFDKQLLLEAAMVENGAFQDLGPRSVFAATYIGLGSPPKLVDAPIVDETVPETMSGLISLISSYLEPHQHYLSRRMLQADRDRGDYDHLARFGEWEDADPPETAVLT